MSGDDTGSLLLAGGPAMLAIALLSVAAVALIVWKALRLLRGGVFFHSSPDDALDAWGEADWTVAITRTSRRRDMRGAFAHAAFVAAHDPAMNDTRAREEVTRVAKSFLAEAKAGLRGLELISTIAPLLGLLGTVLGMIAAFQGLQAAGGAADPSDLAGGIWEALLTTAAGMAVAIPASAALTWFEAVIERLRLDLEDIATRVFVGGP